MSLKNLERRLRKAEVQHQVGDGLPTLFITTTNTRVLVEDGGADSLTGFLGSRLVERLPCESLDELKARCQLEQPHTRVFTAEYSKGSAMPR